MEFDSSSFLLSCLYFLYLSLDYLLIGLSHSTFGVSLTHFVYWVLLHTMVFFSTTLARPLQLATRVMQWSSAVIVMGLTSFFINRGPRGQHTIYQEVIVCY